jgi:hypothetical protein
MRRLGASLRVREPIHYASLPGVTAGKQGSGGRSRACNLVGKESAAAVYFLARGHTLISSTALTPAI